MTLPVITSLTPDTGSAIGGYQVTIVGQGFTDASAVDFGLNTATDLVVVDDTQVTVVVPTVLPVAVGDVEVVLTTPGGTSSPVLFSYTPAPLVASATRFATVGYIKSLGLDPAKVNTQTGTDANGLFGQIQAMPWVTEDQLVRWATSQWGADAVKRLNAAKALLQAVDLIVLIPGS